MIKYHMPLIIVIPKNILVYENSWINIYVFYSKKGKNIILSSKNKNIKDSLRVSMLDNQKFYYHTLRIVVIWMENVGAI